MFWFLLGCAKHVSWEVQPVPGVEVPLVLVVEASEPACGGLARELERTLAGRPGVVLRADAPVHLELSHCEMVVNPQVQVDFNVVGLNYDDAVREERRRYDLDGKATAKMMVDAPGVSTPLDGEARRRDSSPWLTPEAFVVPSIMTFEDSLELDLARNLADRVAPLPETLRRMVYRDPEPGTARHFHNDAVAAERQGDLETALSLAKQAYAADPTVAHLEYLQALQQHAQMVGYAWKME